MSTITVEQYEAMVDDSIIGEHDQIELIEGYLAAGLGAVAAGPPCRRADQAGRDHGYGGIRTKGGGK